MINDLILFGIVIAWSIQKIIDKKLLKDSSSKLFNDWIFITNFILILPLFFFAELIEIKYLVILFIFSFVAVVSSRFLYKGMKKDEVSRVTPFTQFSAFFVIILSMMFLDEEPGLVNIIGIILMIISGFMFSAENGFKKLFSFKKKHFHYFFKENIALILVLISAFLSSLNILINKIVLFNTAAFSLLFFRRVFSFMWVSPSILKKPEIQDWPLFISSRILSSGGIFLFFYVLSKQDVYLTVPILAVQPLLVLLLGHKLLDEKKYFNQRFIAIIIMIVGYVLLKL